MPGAIDPVTTLIVAFLGLLGVTVPPIVVALINRGGKAQAPSYTLAELPPDVVVPRTEYDRLTDTVADMDDRLRDAHQREEVLQRDRDAFYARAIRAEAALMRNGLTIEGA